MKNHEDKMPAFGKAKALPRKTLLIFSLFACAAASHGQTITQTFESGEDTSNWGSSGWTAPAGFTTQTPSFLDFSIGGSQYGQGISSLGQEANRSFKNNTAGLNLLTSDYNISMYVQLGVSGTPPASGDFYIINGDFGANAGDLRVTGVQGATPVWQALDQSTNTWVDLGIGLTLDVPYKIELAVDPVAQTYSATVSQVNTSGVVQQTGSADDLSINSSVFTNGQYGNLLFHVEGSAGTVGFGVDDINISDIPEPSTGWLVAGGLVIVALAIRRRHSRSDTCK